MDQIASGSLIAVTRDKRLASALVDGVEHSRAAREFLDSLIQQENAFAEKIRQELAAGSGAGPEKNAMLEAMKTGFYEDLHKQMNHFFHRQEQGPGKFQA